MNTTDTYLTKTELEQLYAYCLSGVVSKNDLTKMQKHQLVKFAKDRIDEKRQNFYDSINQGLITLSMIGNDFEGYVKRKTIHEQSIIDWLIEYKKKRNVKKTKNNA